MAYQRISGAWLGMPVDLARIWSDGSFITTLLIDATGEMAAFLGKVWFAERTGTKDLHKVGFKFGSVTKAGGSALTVSLQDVDLTTGPPGVPDGTQDQTVAIANADAAFAANTWYQTGAFSADRTVTYGDLLAVVVEYDGGGRLGADAVRLLSLGTNASASLGVPVLNTSSTWATVASALNNLVLEFSDGTFGTLANGFPATALTSTAYGSGSAADELAMKVTLAAPVLVDAVRVYLAMAGGTSDFDVVLYRDTTALQTVSIDANTLTSTGQRWLEVPIPETELQANAAHYVSVKPTTANTVTAYAFDVAAAGHLTPWPGGTALHAATRVDGGAWTPNTTRVMGMALRLSAVDSAVPPTYVLGVI